MYLLSILPAAATIWVQAVFIKALVTEICLYKHEVLFGTVLSDKCVYMMSCSKNECVYVHVGTHMRVCVPLCVSVRYKTYTVEMLFKDAHRWMYWQQLGKKSTWAFVRHCHWYPSWLIWITESSVESWWATLLYHPQFIVWCEHSAIELFLLWLKDVKISWW
jgi:hypothetical protein